MRGPVSAPTIHVFTYKDGLLARLAHDLRLTARRFEIRRAGAELTGRFWPDSLVVDGVPHGAQLDRSALSESDRAKIQRNITDEILHAARFPTIEFAGTSQGSTLTGSLTMVGKTAPVSAPLRREAGRLRAEFTLVPSRWGIPPYKALAGAIKLQDRVLVALDLPLDPAGGPDTPDPCTWSAG